MICDAPPYHAMSLYIVIVFCVFEISVLNKLFIAQNYVELFLFEILHPKGVYLSYKVRPLINIFLGLQYTKHMLTRGLH